MSFPALATFSDDPERNYARWCVYMALQPPFLDFVEPRAKKVNVIRVRARVGRRQVIQSLHWLVQRGYLVEHGRDANGPRRYTLAYAIAPPQSPTGTLRTAA